MDIPSTNYVQTPPDDQQDPFVDIAFQEPASFYTNYCQVLSTDSISPMQDATALNLSSPKLKPKRRKQSSEKTQLGGGRIIRSGGGRRDRHSKVCTARGTRDRRVRLSPNTAIQFYDVQDRLGYDRPSKAIDWLMKEAKAAIDALDEPPQAAGNQSPPNGGIVVVDGLQHLNHAINPDSNFGFFTTAPSSSSHHLQTQTYANQDSMLHQEGFLSGISSDLYDPNFDILRLQRNFHYPWSPSPAPSGRGHHMFCEREPLQSRIIHNSPTNHHQFSGFRLPDDEIPNFESAKDDKGKIPSSSKSSFLRQHQHQHQHLP